MQQLGNSYLPLPSFLQYFSFILNFFNFFNAFSLVGGCLFLFASAWFLSNIDKICEKKSPAIFDLKLEEKLSWKNPSKKEPNEEKVESKISWDIGWRRIVILKGEKLSKSKSEENGEKSVPEKKFEKKLSEIFEFIS